MIREAPKIAGAYNAPSVGVNGSENDKNGSARQWIADRLHRVKRS